MVFRDNIIFSVVVHAMIFTAALFLAGRDAIMRGPERFIAVTLFEPQADADLKKSVASPKNVRSPIKSIGEPARGLREKATPEVPPATQRQEKRPATEVPPMNDPFQINAGPAESSTGADKGNVPSHREEAGQETSPGAVQLAIPGKAGTRGDREGGKNKAASEYPNAVNAIREAIEKATSYPPLARKRGIEGTVTTEFTISSNGYPENIRIVQSSGYEILDAAAKHTVKRASPFPAINGNIEVPITFRITPSR